MSMSIGIKILDVHSVPVVDIYPLFAKSPSEAERQLLRFAGLSFYSTISVEYSGDTWDRSWVEQDGVQFIVYPLRKPVVRPCDLYK